VVSVLVIADLTCSSGRFNFTLGGIGTAVGIGAALSQAIAGSIVPHVRIKNAWRQPAMPHSAVRAGNAFA